MVRLYEIAAFIGSACVDGRSNHAALGLRRSSSTRHASRPRRRLRGGLRDARRPLGLLPGADLHHRRADACRLREQRSRGAGVATGLPAGRYLAGGIRGLTRRPEPPEPPALGRDEVETNSVDEIT